MFFISISGVLSVNRKDLQALTLVGPTVISLPGVTIMNTHTEIHNLAKRGLPENVCQYKHAIMIYKLMKNELCEDEFVQLNFQLVNNARSPKLTFIKRQNYEVGKNIILNRMYVLNNKIYKSWLSLFIDTFKVKYKDLFLRQ